MASKFYQQTIKDIQLYFGVSETCAMYLYHRAKRSKRKDETFLEWNIKLQNALVKADKCLGINWEKIHFGTEETELLTHGIDVNEMDNNVFKWTEEENEGWISVKKKKHNYRFLHTGLII